MSLELYGLKERKVPCSLEQLESVISYFTSLNICQLAAPRKGGRRKKRDKSLAERWKTDWQTMLFIVSVSLLKRLSLQCPHCHRLFSICCDTYYQLKAIHSDHWLEHFIKSFGLSKANTQPGRKNGLLTKIFGEALKCISTDCFCHEFGNPNPRYHLHRSQKLILQYQLMTENAYPGLRHLTLRSHWFD